MIGAKVAAWQETEKDNLLSITAVARRLNLCRKTVEKFVDRKELKVVRIGRRVLVRPRDLEKFIDRRTA